MAYTTTDLIDKFILIEHSGYQMFMKMAADEGADERLKTLARVFANEEKRHAEVYEKLKKEICGELDIEIDFHVYDKVTKFIYEFINSHKNVGSVDLRGMLEFCLEFEKENLALVMSVRGIFVDEKKGSDSMIYDVLTEIIGEEEKHIKNIEGFIK